MNLTKHLRIRITEKQFRNLTKMMKQEKLTLSSFIRAAITDKIKQIENDRISTTK